MQADDDQIHPGHFGRSSGNDSVGALLVSENGTGCVKGGALCIPENMRFC